MTIRFCSLASGSSGNCEYLETDKVRILIDSGLSGIQIQKKLCSIGVEPNTVDCILVTHEHKDHTKGVGVLSRRFNIPIYANQKTWESMEKDIGNIEDSNIKIFKTEKEFEISDLGVLPFKTSHDAEDPVGYSFYYKNKKISIATDTGYATSDIKKRIKGSDILMIESNHDVEMLKAGRYPWFLKKRIMSNDGHLSNEDAGDLIKEVLNGNNETVILSHLSKENNFPDLAYQTVKNVLDESGIVINEDINVEVALRDIPTKVYSL